MSNQAKQQSLSTDSLEEFERVAVEFAHLAGAEITMALGGMLAVRYKGASETGQVWRDPVSEVDHRVEHLVRDRVASAFPDHSVIGEEVDEKNADIGDFVWVLDPIDGTVNFVNGFPLFASSIGLLHKGRPVVGALWCSTGHALRAGVYHAREGGILRFDGSTVALKQNPDVRRRLAGVPRSLATSGVWDTRRTGSAAIECAFVAAGLLEAARFDKPNIWDIAGGIVLVQAGGGRILTRRGGGWSPFERFEGTDLRRWMQPLLIGRADETMMVEGLGRDGDS